MNEINDTGKEKHKKRTQKVLVRAVQLALFILAFSLLSKVILNYTSIPVVLHIIVIMIALCIGAYLVIRILSSYDEYESILNGKAGMIALYSTLLIAPWKYLNNLGFLPELEVHNFLMLIWLTYIAALIRYSYK